MVSRKPLLVGIAVVMVVALGAAVYLVYPYTPWHHRQGEVVAAEVQSPPPLRLPEATPELVPEPVLQSVRRFVPTRIVVRSADGVLLDKVVTEQIRPRFNAARGTWELYPQALDGVGYVYSPEYDPATGTPQLEDRELPGNPSGTAEFGAHGQYGSGDLGFTELMQLPRDPIVLQTRLFVIVVYGNEGQELTYDNLRVYDPRKFTPQGDLDLNLPSTVQLTTCDVTDGGEVENNLRVIGTLSSAISPVG